MSRTSVPLVIIAALAVVVGLAGCIPDSGPAAENTGSPSASTAATETATPSPEPEGPTFSLPADCGAIASAATLNAVFSGVPSRPANGLTRPAPASATKTLECSWFTGDTTGGDVIYYSAPAADSQAQLAVVEASGFTCAAALDGTRCDKTTPNSQFPVDTVETVFTRDDVWIYISMTNIDAAPLLPDIVATAWAV